VPVEAVQVSVTCPSPAVAARPVGMDGATWAGVTAAGVVRTAPVHADWCQTFDASLFAARTRNSYSVPLVRPVSVWLVPLNWWLPMKVQPPLRPAR
jgi:hypothetical protein